MREEIMTLRLPLRPIPDVVDSQDAKWTCHSDQNAEPDKEALHRLRTIECFVDQATMHPDGVA